MTEILFWAAAAVLFYTYVGYGLLAALLVRLRGDRLAPAPFAESDLPAITVVVAAYNEAACSSSPTGRPMTRPKSPARPVPRCCSSPRGTARWPP